MNEKTIHGEHWGSIVITGCVRGFILFSLILLMVVGTVSAAEFAGTVTRVQLQSTAYNNGLSRVLTKNARVYVKDWINTGAKARLEMRFHDGSVITFGGNNDVSIAEFHHGEGDEGTHATLKLLDGAFRAIVANLLDTRRKMDFKVQTPLGVIGVRGTRFWGQHDNQFLQVLLLSGKGVYLENEQGRVDMTQAGIGTDVKPGEAPTKPKRWGKKRVDRALKTVSWE